MAEASRDSEAVDLIRAWINDDGYADVRIAAFQLEGPENFGRFLADVARHGALAYATTWSIDEDDALQAIIDGLNGQLRDQFSKVTKIQAGSLS
ncbi:MAG TPA: DUF5076 domain-containing protein [Croceibacterium sp.]|nr:DUF5076 domain-containing protein [Propylenella sp.]HYD24795.1 DUF5076 domain-containing protein [Croceibacterium sp.]